MGLFEKAGRHVERFKQNATAAAEESAAYECADCGERFHTETDRCSECGSTDIVALEPDETGDA